MRKPKRMVTFNSLFEIRRFQKRIAINGLDDLSILFLRFRAVFRLSRP